MKNKYYQSILAIEKLNRIFLNVLKKQLEKNGIMNITSIEALLIYNIGRNEIPIGRVSEDGYQISTNPAYSIGKLLRERYIIKIGSDYNMKNKYLKLSPKGLEALDKIESIILSQEKELTSIGIDDKKLENTNNILEKIIKSLSLGV